MNALLKSFTLVAVALLAYGFTSIGIGDQVEVDAPGAVIRVGPDGGPGAGVEINAPGVEVNVGVSQKDDAPAEPASPEKTSYWLGILVGDITPELREHLGLEEAGVLVREVVPHSPAFDAGLRAHDILLTANDRPIAHLGDLMDIVRVAGESKKEVAIELLRAGNPKNVTVTPAPRAEKDGAPSDRQPDAEGFFGHFFAAPLEIPGVQIQVHPAPVEGANNLSISVTTVDGKTRVGVRRNEESWDIDLQDPQAIEQLPPDIRRMVEGMTGQRKAGVNLDIDRLMPDFQKFFGARDARLQRRIAAMERRMEELQRRLQGAPQAEVPPADPQDEAPAFDPAADPVEIEIPAEGE